MQQTSTKPEPATVPPVQSSPQSPNDIKDPSIVKNDPLIKDFQQTPVKRRRLSSQNYTQSFLRHHHQQQQQTPYYPHHQSLSTMKYSHQIKVVPAILPPPLPTTVPTKVELKSTEKNDENAENAVKNEAQPSTMVEDKCSNCGNGGDLSRCSVCRWAMYCNGTCQMAHWPVHKKECKKPPSPPVESTSPSAVGYYNQYPNGYPPSPISGARNYYSPQTYNRPYSSSYVKPAPVTNPHQYRCNICLKTFKNGHALGGHRSSVHYVGSGNGRRTAGKERKPRVRNRRRSAAMNKDGKYECTYCGKIFLSGNALGGHISGAHTKRHTGRGGGPLRLRRRRSTVDSDANDISNEYNGSPRRGPSRNAKRNSVGNEDGGKSLDSWRGSGGSKCDGCDTPVQGMADDVELTICERCKYTCCDHCLKDHSTGTCYCKDGNFGTAYPEKREWWMRGMW